MSKKRSKSFATLVYPESTYFQDLLSLLGDFKISYLISPLHSQDMLEDSSFKKPHYHVILIFDSLKSLDQVQSILDASTIGRPIQFCGLEIVNSLVHYARYLCHLDSPDKFRYNVKDVVAFGLDYAALIASKADKFTSFVSLLDFIQSHNNFSFADLCFYARHNDPDMLMSILQNSFTIREIIRSLSVHKS